MAAVLWHPAGRAQQYIGLFYIFQIIGHIAYGGRLLLGYNANALLYYDALTVIAWLQLLTLGVVAYGSKIFCIICGLVGIRLGLERIIRMGIRNGRTRGRKE